MSEDTHITGYGDFIEKVREREGDPLADHLQAIADRDDALSTLRESADANARELSALGIDVEQSFRDIEALDELGWPD